MNTFELKGHKVISITKPNLEEFLLRTEKDGKSHEFRFYHIFGCCESVTKADAEPSATILDGLVIDFAEDDAKPEETKDGSQTETIFTLGSGDLRMRLVFVVESNGYYGETVEIEQVEGVAK